MLDAVSSGDDRFQRMLDSITKTRMDDPEMTKAEEILRTLCAYLESQEWIKETFLIGSYERRTLAKFPRHDIDVFCVVDLRHPSAPIHINRDDPTPRQLIRAVHSVTQKAVLSAYPGALVNSQKHSVGVFPTKGPHSDEHVTIDVIPAVEHDEPGYGRMYKIPERGTTKGDSGHLILSNPLAVKRELERKNELSSGKLLELVRLMKTWNQKKQNTKIIKNFHMELLCYEAAGEISDRSMSMKKACQVLFQYLSRHVQDECYVPGCRFSQALDAANVLLCRLAKTTVQTWRSVSLGCSHVH